jgi:hypothetical protein
MKSDLAFLALVAEIKVNVKKEELRERSADCTRKGIVMHELIVELRL